MARRPRDYAAEYARRQEPGRRITRGQAAGRLVSEVPRQVARGHFEAPPRERQAPLPRLPRRATEAQRVEREQLIKRRALQRRVAAARRATITGEHPTPWQYHERAPGEVSGGGPFTSRPFPARALGRLVRAIRALPEGTLCQVVGFGDLIEGYAVDWRGTRDQWRTILTGPSDGPVTGISGEALYPDWSVATIETGAMHARGPLTGPFEAVRLYELRVYAD